MKNYRPWLIAALIIQLLTGLIHSLSLFHNVEPQNESEKTMVTLMDTYKMDLGAGYQRTFAEMFLALSACFSLVYLLGGLINWQVLRKKATLPLLKGLLNVQLLIFGIGFGLMFCYTFLPPIVLTGLSFFLLLVSRLLLPKQEGQ